jgi:putative tryptophan/tyrosine transport system substrate-binding protein
MRFDRVKRREFFTLLGGAAAWPLATLAQQAALPVVGFVNGASPDVSRDRLRAFGQGLSESGYVEAQNLTVEYYWLGGQYDCLPAMMANLVLRRVAVIAAPADTRVAIAAKAATATIAIVFE